MHRKTNSPNYSARFATCAAVALISVAGCGVPPGTTSTPRTAEGIEPFSFNLTVARHIDQPLSDQRVNRIFSTADALLLKVDNNCDDVSCPVTFQRAQSVATFDNTPAIVTTESQMDALFDNPADIKIVTLMVGVCGSPSANEVSLVLGCAFTGGTAVLVQDAPPDVWAHEWGHVQGLGHRSECAQNLMHAFELETNAVDVAERNAFLSPTPGRGLTAFRAISDRPSVEFDPDQDGFFQSSEQSRSLEDLMGRRYLAGFPRALFEQHALNMRGADLRQQLTQEPSPRYRANIARALGLSRDLVACESFLSDCGSIGGELEIDELDELIEKIIALGRLAGVDNSNRTTELLLAGSDPSFWRGRDLNLRIADDRVLNLEEALARVCVLGLGLSENPNAVNSLRELKRKSAAGINNDPWFVPQIDEAIARIEGTGKFAKQAKSHRLP
ncbi:MAG: hypothetical protein GXP29_01770 [Planctomycetes bacterium]|nr:hypothetical protein [Planctomycetota bacterium]